MSLRSARPTRRLDVPRDASFSMSMPFARDA
jgi:hypothetical protein